MFKDSKLVDEVLWNLKTGLNGCLSVGLYNVSASGQVDYCHVGSMLETDGQFDALTRLAVSIKQISKRIVSERVGSDLMPRDVVLETQDYTLFCRNFPEAVLTVVMRSPVHHPGEVFNLFDAWTPSLVKVMRSGRGVVADQAAHLPVETHQKT